MAHDFTYRTAALYLLLGEYPTWLRRGRFAAAMGRILSWPAPAHPFMYSDCAALQARVVLRDRRFVSHRPRSLARSDEVGGVGGFEVGVASLAEA
jgi:hypothetical protein